MSADRGTLFSTDALFQPFVGAGLRLRNRIAMSPMTREFSVEGVLPPEAAEYYASRARGGAGLIVTEATTINHDVAHYSTREPYMFGARALAAWKQVVNAVHAEGSAIFPQLWHTGLGRKRRQTHNPETPSIAPSAISSVDLLVREGGALASRRSSVLPRPATDADLAGVIAAFGQAASDAKRIGCDGVAIHGAHGYLLYQFYWESSNRRDDDWGGSFDARARLSLEVVREVRRRVGPDFPIMFRFSQWAGWDYSAKLAKNPHELERLLLPLADAGVDIFDASTRRFWIPEFAGSDLNLAGWARTITGKPAMTVGSVGLESPLGDARSDSDPVTPTTDNLRRLVAMLERGEFDLVAVGRAMLANPDWAAIVQAGRWDALAPYDAERCRAAL